MDEPTGVAPPDPLRILAEQLEAPEAKQALAALSPVDQATLTAIVVAEGRAAPSPDWLARLEALRSHLLLANQRPSYGLCLAGIADVAGALGDQDRRIQALGKVVGLRDLQREPERAHDALLVLAAAQAEAGRDAEAEASLMNAVERARRMAPGGHLVEASVRTANSLTRLGCLLAGQGRIEEARAWLEGALELAQDDDGRAVAQEALAALDAG